MVKWLRKASNKWVRPPPSLLSPVTRLTGYIHDTLMHSFHSRQVLSPLINGFDCFGAQTYYQHPVEPGTSYPTGSRRSISLMETNTAVVRVAAVIYARSEYRTQLAMRRWVFDENVWSHGWSVSAYFLEYRVVVARGSTKNILVFAGPQFYFLKSSKIARRSRSKDRNFVVVLTLTRIIKSVVTGQAPVTPKLRNALG